MKKRSLAILLSLSMAAVSMMGGSHNCFLRGERGRKRARRTYTVGDKP